MITTVVFDMDDTLYDELDYCRSGFKAAGKFITDSFKGIQATQAFESLWTEFNGGNRTRTFNAALDALGVSYDEKYIAELVKCYRNHAPEITLPDESRSVLEELSKDYDLALLSDGFMPAQRLKAQALGVEKFFKCIIFTEELGRKFWKPSTVGFEKIIGALGANPRTTVYVGDNAVKDFIAPNKLGFISIQLVRPCGIHRQPAPDPSGKARYLINNITELPALIKSI